MKKKKSLVGKAVKVSAIGWSKSYEGTWRFDHYCDNLDRKWERDQDGFLVICTGHRIEGYCIKGKESQWKKQLLEEVIDMGRKDLADIQDRIDEMASLLESC